MDRTVCSHNNRPSECQQCEDEIPTFLRGIDIERGRIAALRAELEQAHNAKRVAEERELEAAQELDSLRAELEQAQADIREYRNLAEVLMENNRSGIKLASDLLVAEKTIARQREWIEKAGHMPGCAAETEFHAVSFGELKRYEKHPDGPCTCGYAELVGG